MFCGNCGKEVEDDWVVCPYCNAALKNKNAPRKTVRGQESNFYSDKPQMRNEKNSKLPTISMILGIVGIILSFIVIGIIPCTIGLVLSIRALSGHVGRKKRSIVGLITSIIGIVIAILILMAAVTSDEDTVTNSEVRVAETELNRSSEELPIINNETEEIVDANNELQQDEESFYATENLNIDELPIYSMDYLTAYVDANDIQVPKVSKKAEIDKALTDNSASVCLKKDGDKFVATVEDTEWVYIGEIKDNKPVGVGKILRLVSVNQYEENGITHLDIGEYQSYVSEEDIYFVLSYVGEFKDGYYSGYGWEFASPVLDSNDPGYNIYVRNIGYDYVSIYDDLQQNILNSCNPIEYMGEFKKGKRCGEGVKIEYAIREVPEYTDISGIKESVGYEIDRELQITVGEYENNYINGKVKQYLAGNLLYSGNMKDGSYNGEGTLYYIRSEQIKYKGEWKNGNYHGKGILYNEDGTVVYDGKWSNGDYAP